MSERTVPPSSGSAFAGTGSRSTETAVRSVMNLPTAETAPLRAARSERMGEAQRNDTPSIATHTAAARKPSNRAGKRFSASVHTVLTVSPCRDRRPRLSAVSFIGTSRRRPLQFVSLPPCRGGFIILPSLRDARRSSPTDENPTFFLSPHAAARHITRPWGEYHSSAWRKNITHPKGEYHVCEANISAPALRW